MYQKLFHKLEKHRTFSPHKVMLGKVPGGGDDEDEEEEDRTVMMKIMTVVVVATMMIKAYHIVVLKNVRMSGDRKELSTVCIGRSSLSASGRNSPTPTAEMLALQVCATMLG